MVGCSHSRFITVPSQCDSSPVPSVPIGVTAFEPTNSSVRVTWTAPSSAGSIALLGYRVSFERLINGVGCDSPHNATESVGSTTTDYTVTGLSGFSTYRIGVSAGNIFGSSMDVNSNILDTLSSRESCVHASFRM